MSDQSPEKPTLKLIQLVAELCNIIDEQAEDFSGSRKMAMAIIRALRATLPAAKQEQAAVNIAVEPAFVEARQRLRQTVAERSAHNAPFGQLSDGTGVLITLGELRILDAGINENLAVELAKSSSSPLEPLILAYLTAMEARAYNDRSAASYGYLCDATKVVRREIEDPARAGCDFRTQKRGKPPYTYDVPEPPLTIALPDYHVTKLVEPKQNSTSLDEMLKELSPVEQLRVQQRTQELIEEYKSYHKENSL